MKLTKAFRERQVVALWQNLMPGRTDLITEEGEPIKIIYPGRINDDHGADLLDAVIATGQGLVKGDIEVHVASSNWWAHRHHQDPAYNRVILHVVFWHDIQITVSLQNGQKVPTLALHRYIKNQTDNGANYVYPLANRHMPCRNTIGRGHTFVINEFLDKAGEERFLAKATQFQAALAQEEASQSLYRGIMVALGYTRNKQPMLELSRRMPLKRLEAMTSDKLADAEYLAQQQALLMGTAGLLPSQRSLVYGPEKRGDECIEKLEKLWASSGQTEPMSEDDWHFFKVRPSNFPTRRIVAMSYLLLRHRERGMLEDLVNKLREVPADGGCTELGKTLKVTTDGYWANHLDFGLPSRMSIPALLGDGRAADIIVNVLLPFAVAWARLSARPELAAKAIYLYRHHPKLALNTLERHMSHQLGINHYLVNSAQRQQGLIHIYQALCSQGKCDCCPIGGVAD